MTNQILKLNFLLFLFLGISFTACVDEGDLSDVDIQNFTDESVFKLQEEANCGRHGCYELIFPIDIAFGDEVVEIGGYQELISAIREWKQDNPSAATRPQFVYPIELADPDGNIFSVASKEEMAEYRKLCIRVWFQNHDWNGHSNRPMFCFRPVYPLTIELPSGILVTAQDKYQMRNILREWKENNPDSDQRPTLVFPMTVFMNDGTLVEVESKEALKELKEECRD
ncbi:MAG: hypothetical protein HKN16_10615 [Saprospiraceae bacterium]|nr:hypothetical protein [Saprospiraceae bacterium]